MSISTSFSAVQFSGKSWNSAARRENRKHRTVELSQSDVSLYTPPISSHREIAQKEIVGTKPSKPDARHEADKANVAYLANYFIQGPVELPTQCNHPYVVSISYSRQNQSINLLANTLDRYRINQDGEVLKCPRRTTIFVPAFDRGRKFAFACISEVVAKLKRLQAT